MSKIYYFKLKMMKKHKYEVKFDFLNLFDKISNVIWRNKVRKISKKIISMFEYTNDNNFCLFKIGEFRLNNKPFIGDINSEEEFLKKIDKDIIELGFVYFENSTKTLVLQKSNKGVTEKNLEEYLNTFISDTDYTIQLKKIIDNVDLIEIKKSPKIQKITFKAIQHNLPSPLISDESGNIITNLRNLLSKANQSLNTQDFQIEFKNTKKGLNVNNMVDLIVEMETDFFEEVTLTYLSPMDNKPKTVSLKTYSTQLKSEIPNEFSDKESIINTFKSDYDQKIEIIKNDTDDNIKFEVIPDNLFQAEPRPRNIAETKDKEDQNET